MATPASKTILIMDDSPLVLEMARAALEEAGFAVLAAADLAAFEVERRKGPDLVLLDVQMPQILGDKVGNVLRTLRGVKVPILLFSNLGNTELQLRAREAGVDGFISKRAGVSELVARVRAVLEPEVGR